MKIDTNKIEIIHMFNLGNYILKQKYRKRGRRKRGSNQLCICIFFHQFFLHSSLESFAFTRSKGLELLFLVETLKEKYHSKELTRMEFFEVNLQLICFGIFVLWHDWVAVVVLTSRKLNPRLYIGSFKTPGL